MPDAEILGPTDRLLLAACAPESFSPTEVLTGVEPERLPADWALHQARENRVISFVWNLLEREPFSGLAAARGDGWKKAVNGLLERNDAALEQVEELAGILRARGLRGLLYKGLDFQLRFYPKDRPRGFHDIDVIVAPEEADSAAAAFRAAGYTLWPEDLPLDYYRRFHLHAIYQRPADRLLPFELHWALDSPYADVPSPLPELFAAAEHADYCETGILCPAKLDALALMVGHLDKHLGLCARLPTRKTRLKGVIEGGGLQWLVDIVQWFRTEGDRHDPDAILARARELGAEYSLGVGLRLACDLDPSGFPEAAKAIAAASDPRRSFLVSLVYPDLARRRAVTKGGRRRRQRLDRPLPGLVFRPLVVLEFLLPGALRRGDRRRMTLRSLGRLGLLALRNTFALIRWKLLPDAMGPKRSGVSDGSLLARDAESRAKRGDSQQQ